VMSCLINPTVANSLVARQPFATVPTSMASSCSYAIPSSHPAILHCGSYGTLNATLINEISNFTAKSYQDCQNNCLYNTSCISFGYNYTSSFCHNYGLNLVQMGLVVNQTADPDTIYYNRHCFSYVCASTTSTTYSFTTSGSVTSTIMTTTVPSTSISAASAISVSSSSTGKLPTFVALQ